MIAAFALPGETEPGMLAAPENVEAVHLTPLRPDGSGKADVVRPKLFLGSPGDRPIVVALVCDLLALAITEGIEDALSVWEATGCGVWAAGSAGRMPALAATIPSWVEVCTIWAHTDEAGQAGAFALADALDHRGIEVRIVDAGNDVHVFTFAEVLDRIKERDRLGVALPIEGGRRYG